MRLHVFKIVIIILIPSFVFAKDIVSGGGGTNQKMSHVEIFNRCYMKMFQSVVPRTASLGKTLLDLVSANQMTSSGACMALLKQAKFNDNGIPVPAGSATLPQLSDKENEALITNFNNFHSTWFTKRNLDFESFAISNSTLLLRDNDEPPLYLTRALFGNNIALSSLFTANKSLKGLRRIPGGNTSNWKSKTLPAENEAIINNSASFLLSYGFVYANPIQISTINVPDDQLMTFGKLYGVQEVNQSLVVPQINLNQTNSTRPQTSQTQEMVSALYNARLNVNIKEHFGAGVLGSQMFILKNTNLTFDAAGGIGNDKESVVARRISRRIFEDLLCQQMPTLSEADVAAEIISNSPHGFRQSTSCMNCHTSLDPLAYTFRNFVAYRTGDNHDVPASFNLGTPVNGVVRLPSSGTSTVFALQPASGSLNYRDHTNNLIKKPITSLTHLGSELAQADDFYRCVAKRYYEFFTGYNVNLTPRNISESQNTKQAQFHRNKVYALATNLKASQKISLLIQEILNSEAFTYRDYVVP